ncbi:MAG TPA: phosphotransferase family protein [Spongiibacteraceae bacterium]|nr:phosphotransferase family protein [Spongiibacteraceae bacterium]HCS28486.1 phosphotransferase family protein [Spongiibacteraceae bacterium]|tara:strand:- start:1855 stop:2862 length:1008 start_codon:yes stop_codon:yes gene_type:complete
MTEGHKPLRDLLTELLAPALSSTGERPAITQLQRLTGGAAAQTWAFVAELESESHALILRLGQDQQQFGAALSKRQEAQLITAARHHGVLAPEVVVSLPEDNPLGEGFVMRRLAGEALPQRILRDDRYARARENLTGQCADNLAAIHSIPQTRLDNIPAMDADTQLDFYRSAYLGYPLRSAAFEYAFRWLRQHRPDTRDEALVHGDFRNGNLLVDEQGISAVLDWELAHIGDPMEDLGWLCVNSWRFGRRDKPVGGFGQRDDLYRAYERASGRVVKADHVHYWEVFGTLKWGVICLYQAHVHLSGSEPSLERAAIGRRVSECEVDVLSLLRGQQP